MMMMQKNWKNKNKRNSSNNFKNQKNDIENFECDMITISDRNICILNAVIIQQTR